MNDDQVKQNFIDIEGTSQILRIRPQIYLKLVRSFAASLTGKIKLLSEMVANNDRDQMRMILHEIRGTAGNLRLTNIIGPETVMHTAVKAGANTAMLTVHLEVLRVEAERLQQFLSQLPEEAGGV